MPQPTRSDVHVDAILTNVSVAYIQSHDAFIAPRVFPVIPVGKKTDKYFTYTKADWFRDEMKRRASGSESQGSGYGLSTASYSCDVFALHKDLGRDELENYDDPLRPFEDASEFLTQRGLLRLEKQWVADYFATSIWGTDATPANLWSNYATSDPISDIKTGRITILQNTGFKPNTLVLGYQVYEQLKDHPDLLDRIKYSGQSMLTVELMARLFEVDRVLVAQAIENTAVEGATGSYAFTHGKHALLAYVEPSPGLLKPSAGYTFMWTGVSQGLGETSGITRFPMPQLKSERLEIEMAWDNKVVATDLGYFFNSAVS